MIIPIMTLDKQVRKAVLLPHSFHTGGPEEENVFRILPRIYPQENRGNLVTRPTHPKLLLETNST